MNYNNTYSKSKNAWGIEPSKLLQIIQNDIPEKSNILDLGSGQGKDALFLASQGHKITAVEKSEIGNAQLSNAITKNNLTNITPINQDVLGFDIKKDEYALINAQNILQFLPKKRKP